MKETDSVELPEPVETTIGFAPTVLDANARTGVTNVRLVAVTLVGVTSTPSILTVVAVPVGSKFDPDTVTVVPPAAVPEVGEIELIDGAAEANEMELSPLEISIELRRKEITTDRLEEVRTYLAKLFTPQSQENPEKSWILSRFYLG